MGKNQHVTPHPSGGWQVKGAEQKVIENNLKYPDISTAIKMVPGINVIPFSEVSDEGVRDNLKMQIEAMCFKEYNLIKS